MSPHMLIIVVWFNTCLALGRYDDVSRPGS